MSSESRGAWLIAAGIALVATVGGAMTHSLGAQKMSVMSVDSTASTTATTVAIRFPRWHSLPKGTAPLASLVVPGAGQVMLGRDRFIVYVAIEALSWWQYAKATRERSQQEAEFRDIARRVARAHLSPNGPDGDWQYYETMRDYKESGQFSKSDTQLIPETNDSTFNGHIWELAKGLSPDSLSALEYYKTHAYGPDMEWSWLNAGLQKSLFEQATNKRNDANYTMNNILMLIAANHLISMVDAFATFRLEARPLGNGRTALGARMTW